MEHPKPKSTKVPNCRSVRRRVTLYCWTEHKPGGAMVSEGRTVSSGSLERRSPGSKNRNYSQSSTRLKSQVARFCHTGCLGGKLKGYHRMLSGSRTRIRNSQSSGIRNGFLQIQHCNGSFAWMRDMVTWNASEELPSPEEAVIVRFGAGDGRQQVGQRSVPHPQGKVPDESTLYFDVTSPVFIPMIKVVTYHHVYRAEQKEPTQFGSVSGSEIQNLPFSHSGIVSLYRSEPIETS